MARGARGNGGNGGNAFLWEVAGEDIHELFEFVTPNGRAFALDRHRLDPVRVEEPCEAVPCDRLSSPIVAPGGLLDQGEPVDQLLGTDPFLSELGEDVPDVGEELAAAGAYVPIRRGRDLAKGASG